MAAIIIPGQNASLIKGDLAETVASLKRQHRGNLISFGGGELAHPGLADEVDFRVQPAVWVPATGRFTTARSG